MPTHCLCTNWGKFKRFYFFFRQHFNQLTPSSMQSVLRKSTEEICRQFSKQYQHKTLALCNLMDAACMFTGVCLHRAAKHLTFRCLLPATATLLKFSLFVVFCLLTRLALQFETVARLGEIHLKDFALPLRQRLSVLLPICRRNCLICLLPEQKSFFRDWTEKSLRLRVSSQQIFFGGRQKFSVQCHLMSFVYAMTQKTAKVTRMTIRSQFSVMFTREITKTAAEWATYIRTHAGDRAEKLERESMRECALLTLFD